MALELNIKGTFDIALSRQQLRKASDLHHWSPQLRLQSVVALTSMAEVLFFKRQSNSNMADSLNIYIELVEVDGVQGIEFHAETDFGEISRHYGVARWQLERACDQLEIHHLGDHCDHIVMRLFTKDFRR
jgi:hypothetical protein